MNNHLVAVLALNKHAVTDRCLGRVRASGFAGPVLLVDNGSDPPMDDIARRHGCRYHRNPVNQYVNPVWNWLFRTVRERYLTLLNNDCLLRDGYLDEVPGILESFGLALASPNETFVEDVGKVADDLARENGAPLVDRTAVRTGHVMTVNLGAYRRCPYRIPRQYRIWFGDEWMWGQLRLHGYACARIVNRTCVAGVGTTTRSVPALEEIVRREIDLANTTRRMIQLRILAGVRTAADLEQYDHNHGLGARVKRLAARVRRAPAKLWRMGTSALQRSK